MGEPAKVTVFFLPSSLEPFGWRDSGSNLWKTNVCLKKFLVTTLRIEPMQGMMTLTCTPRYLDHPNTPVCSHHPHTRTCLTGWRNVNHVLNIQAKYLF